MLWMDMKPYEAIAHHWNGRKTADHKSNGVLRGFAQTMIHSYFIFIGGTLLTFTIHFGAMFRQGPTYTVC